MQGKENQQAALHFLSASSITAIIPAYNEAAGIGGVLDVLAEVACLSEIIVIDDGSTDRTAELARKQVQKDSRFRLISHAENQGKGQAILTGWAAAHSPVLLTLDADLIGLNPGQVRELTLPVVKKRVDMTIGLFRGGYWRTDLGHRATPWLSGQRCFRSDLLRDISVEASAGYGFETAITIAAKKRGCRIQHVVLRGVTHPPSETHRGFLFGTQIRSRMYTQIIRAWYLASKWPGVIARLKDWASD